MAVVAHVDLCTNRSGLDNSTHQSRPHNPFLKDRTNGRQQSGRTAQRGTTTPTTQHNKKDGEVKTRKHPHKNNESTSQHKGGGQTCTATGREKEGGSCHSTQAHWRGRGEKEWQTLTIITAPVNVDAASVVAGKLGEGKTGRVG